MVSTCLVGSFKKLMVGQYRIFKIRSPPGAIGCLTEATGFFVGALSILNLICSSFLNHFQREKPKVLKSKLEDCFSAFIS